MHHDSMAQSPAHRPARLSPPLALFPLRKLTEWSKLIWTTVRGVKKAECTSDEPATDEARPAPEVVPLRPVSDPSDSRCETRPVARPVPRPLPIPPPLRMLPPPEERLPCEKRVTPTRAHKRVTWASDVPATDEARPAPEVVPLRPVSGASDARCETRPVPRPLPIPPPLRMLPPPEERLPCEKRVTPTRAHKRVTWASDVPATDEARPAPEVVPLRPVSGASDARCETRPVPRPLPIPPPLRMLPPPEERLPCEKRVTPTRAHKRVTWASDVPATDEARPAPEVVPLRPVSGASDARCETRPVPRPLPIPPPLRMLPPPEERLPCEKRVTPTRAHKRVTWASDVPATDEACPAPEVVPLRPVSGASDARCGSRRGSRPLCGCKKQRTDRESRLSGALLRLYSRAGLSAAEIRFRVRQRRELGIERFRRVGLCTEESDAGTLQPGDVLPRTDADTASGVASNAATLPPGDVLPRTDADTASGVASNAATLPPGDVLPRTDTATAVGLASAVGQPIPLRPVSGPSGTRCGRSRGSRPLCGCKKQRTDRESRLSGALLRLYSRAGLSAAEIRFRVRQRRELGIERFRRVGLCTEESDAGTLQPGDVLPRTDADTASGVASNAATLPPGDVLPRTDTATAVGLASAVGQPIPLRPVSGPSGTRCGRSRGSRPLCGCKKQRTDREIRLSGVLLGLYSRAGLSAAEIRFRVRQRRELGIERFRRVGLCTEESDAGTLQPGDVLPRTDADTASGVASNAATLPPGDVLPRTDTATAVGLASAVGQPIPLRPVSGPSGTRCGRSRGSRPLCGCKKQRTDRESRLSGALLRLYSRAGLSAAEIRFRVRQRRELGIERFRRVGLCTEESDAATLPPIHCPLSTPQQQALPAVSLWTQEGPQPPIRYPLSTPQQQALPAVSLWTQEGPQPPIRYPLSTPQQQALPAVSLWTQEGPQPPIRYPLSTPQQQALPAVSLWTQEGPQPAIQHSRWNPFSFTGGDAVRTSTGRAIKY
ncbi:hypothetical protein LPMP_0520030 [Leishmania panamensis]|uniref:Uncharacterized protein n=1 Tax=Leishmania panamensis TaxID=5679 RepID=A0AC62A6V4_LEIPA